MSLVQHPPQNHDYIFDDSFFHTIDTEEKAYWLGMLVADGNVSDFNRKSYTIRLLLKDCDIYHVENFCRSIKLDKKVRVDKFGRGSIAIHSKRMFFDLAAHGVRPGKTGHEQLPNIPDGLFRHFLRGFFDGDGTIYSRKQTDAKRKRALCAIGWICMNRQFLEQLHSKVYKLCGVMMPIHEKITKFGSVVYETKTEAINNNLKLIHFMYDDATVFLQRKKERADDFLKKLPLSGRKPRK